MNKPLRHVVILLRSFSLLFFSVLLNADASDTRAYTLELDDKVMYINQLQMNSTSKSLLTGTDGGGTLSAFWHEGEIRRLNTTIGMSNRTIEDIFYYEKGHLIVAISRQSFFVWDETRQKLDANTSGFVMEDRYYFIDGKLRQWNTMRTGTEGMFQDHNFAEKEKIVLLQENFFMQAVSADSETVDARTFIKRGIP